ncbi:Imm59 family immunity protein [Streptococcus equinus]|uniref:Imm59 family immunity protein n=1 Tax=Streptococcus equinus TaxID=1335 RepID=UPI003BF7CCA5
MPNLQIKKQEILEEIEKRNYQTLRYSIFEAGNPHEWETRIDYDKTRQVYQVYATMDRASVRGKYEFLDFNSAKDKFIELLDLTIEINRWKVEDGKQPIYYSPLWSDYKPIEMFTTVIDYCDIEDGNLELIILDENQWEGTSEKEHLQKLEEKLNTYLEYIDEKCYVSKCGENFDKIIIQVGFRHHPSENGMRFMKKQQQNLSERGIILEIVLNE